MRPQLVAAWLAAGLASCGGGGQGANSPNGKVAGGNAQEGSDWERPPEASAEIGALDEDAVNEAFGATMDQLMQCRNRGAKRVEFLGGSVRFFLKIDSSGRVAHVHLKKTTLGDRATEKCMLDVVRKKRWPKPVGGEHGIAESGFSFDADDVRPPTEWSPDRVGETIDGIGAELERCGNVSGLTATVYVGTDGQALSAGAAPPSEDAEARVDCAVEALLDAEYASPGSWPAKVTFTL